MLLEKTKVLFISIDIVQMVLKTVHGWEGKTDHIILAEAIILTHLRIFHRRYKFALEMMIGKYQELNEFLNHFFRP